MGLTFTPAPESTAPVNLSVTATDTEPSSNSSASSTVQTLTINVIPTATAVAPTLVVPAPDAILGGLTLVSSNASSVEGNNPFSNSSVHPTYSQDGTEVAFYSPSTNLVPGATAGSYQLYVKNVTTGAISLASSNAAGVEANSGTGFPPDNTSQVRMFSPDGTQVVFTSQATNLVPGVSSGINEVYVKNLTTGAITLVSANANGVAANAGEYLSSTDSFSFSPDGTEVVFNSPATNLTATKTDASDQIFLKNLATGAISLISTNASGVEASGSTGMPVFSPDGTEIAFVSESTNEILVKNLVTGALTLASADANGVAANGFTWLPEFSPDGTEVAFSSSASNLTSGVGGEQIYLKNLTTGAITLVSANASGVAANNGGNCQVAGFSPDGTKIIFYSNATNLAAAASSGITQVFMKDLVTGAVSLVSANANGIQSNGGGADSNYSPAGTAIAFGVWGNASNLIPGDGGSQIYQRAVTPGRITDENTPLLLTGITATLAPSNNSDTLSLSLNVGHGMLTLGSTTGLTITSDGSSGVLAFSGSQTDISAALASGIFYAPAAGYAGSDTLTVTATDTASNNSTASATKTLALSITAGTFSYTMLNVPPGGTWPFGINDSGQITGSDSTGGFLFSDGTYTPINVPSANSGSTNPRGINNAGEVVGGFYVGTTGHGFLYSGGNFSNVDVPGANFTLATDINATDEVVGYYGSPTGTHGFLLTGGSYQSFDDPQGISDTLPQGINAAGDIVGAYVDSTNKIHGFLYNHSTGAFATIDDPQGVATVAQSINAAGQVVGYYYDSGGNYHGFLYSGGSYLGLDDPTALNTPGDGTRAFGINDAGQIVGMYYGNSSNSGQHGFLAVDPPAASSVVADGDTAELGAGASPDVQFAGNSGTLQLDQSTGFTGTITGFGAQDQIDLRDIAFCANQTLGYSPNSDDSGGTLTASDGLHSANISLLGQYMASSFAAASDGHGGTLITEAAVIAQNQLTQPHA